MVKKTGRVADRVAGQLRREILTGERLPGSILPSERALCSQLGVNRASVRTALRALVADRFLEVRQGDGTVVRDIWRDGGLEMLSHVLEVSGLLDLSLLEELLEARRLFCVTAAQLAASRPNRRVIDELVQIQQEARGQMRSSEQIQASDYAFFFALAKGSGNRLMVLMMNSIRSLYLRFSGIFRLLYWDVEAYLDARDSILSAVDAGDPQLAVRQVRKLLTVSSRTVTGQ